MVVLVDQLSLTSQTVPGHHHQQPTLLQQQHLSIQPHQQQQQQQDARTFRWDEELIDQDDRDDC